jgi:hypothetical protein
MAAQALINAKSPITPEIRALVEKAEQGDISVLPELRKLLDNSPELWQAYGDLAQLALNSWLSLICGSNLCLQESIRRKLDELYEEWGHKSASPLERLLIERLGACWLQLQYADIHYAQSRTDKAHPAQVKVAERLQSRAHNRYLSAIRQLVNVRKLLTPALSPLQLAQRSVAETTGKATQHTSRFPANAFSSGHAN